MNTKGMTDYSASPTTVHRLDALVDRIEANPGAFIDIRNYEDRYEAMDLSGLQAALPGG